MSPTNPEAKSPAADPTAQPPADPRPAIALKPLRFGLRARAVVLPQENRQEFYQLCDELEAEWRPQTRTEQFLLELMAISQWKLARLEIGEVDLFSKHVEAKDQLALLDAVSRHQARLERNYFRSMRELERLQQNRRLLAARQAQVASPPAENLEPNKPENRRRREQGRILVPLNLEFPHPTPAPNRRC